MSTIQVSCIDQVLTMTNTPVIASGGIKEDRVAFTFCPMWDGYYKTAVFWRTEDEVYNQVLDDTNSCDIPPEVLGTEGVLYFGVFGVNDEEAQRTSEVLRYTIERGAITEGGKPSDPTPDIYTQLLAKIAALGDNKGKADKVSSATEGNFAGLDANGNLTDSGVKATNFIPATEKGVAGGVASLDDTGKVPSGQLPAMDYAEKIHASKHAIGGIDPVTPASIGAVNKAGDTMTGNLYVKTGAVPTLFLKSEGAGYSSIYKNNSSAVENGTHIQDVDADGNSAVLKIQRYKGIENCLGVELDGDGKVYNVLHSGNFSDYNTSWITAWPVPLSYGDLTTYATPYEEGGQYARKVIDLPEPIDGSKFFYSFRVTVFGLMRKGDTSTTLSIAAVNLIHTEKIYDDGFVAYFGDKICGLPITEAASDLSSDLSFPSLCKTMVECHPPLGYYTKYNEGCVGGEYKSYGQNFSIAKSALLGNETYTKLELKFNLGSSLNPVQTFGIKFEYRKTIKKG